MSRRVGDGHGEDDDALAFAEAVRGAKPLAAAREDRGRIPLTPGPKHGPPPRTAGGPYAPAGADAADAFLDTPDALAHSDTFEIATMGEAIEARARGVDAKLLRKLKAGEPRPEARLDLHGRSRAEALAALERFIAGAREQGRRCVLVIHGRGAHSSDDAPVLKPLVWRWLAASPQAAAAVLAFISARPGEGGDGATRVLLRKPSR
ncbi:MAG TPA: Smr/MutS family protein [Polyangia bacterium]|nr:Smr/MutS family protein [Polyangia bacterium]